MLCPLPHYLIAFRGAVPPTDLASGVGTALTAEVAGGMGVAGGVNTFKVSREVEGFRAFALFFGIGMAASAMEVPDAALLAVVGGGT